jgi:hypothetical protein
MKTRTLIVVIAVVLTAVFASTALAAGNSSSKFAYGSKGAKVQAVLAAKTTVKAKPKAKAKAAPKVVKVAAVKSATLPFTGLDLGFIAGAGIVLVGMGLSLRKVARKQPGV